MISKVELLSKMPGNMSLEDLIADVEKAMIEAAKQGKRSVSYHLPTNTVKEIIDALYITLGSNGYTVSGGYDIMTIKW